MWQEEGVAIFRGVRVELLPTPCAPLSVMQVLPIVMRLVVVYLCLCNAVPSRGRVMIRARRYLSDSLLCPLIYRPSLVCRGKRESEGLVQLSLSFIRGCRREGKPRRRP